MSDCVFCKILNKDIPAEFIYEDEECIAFRDINPKAETHVLIVPKEHIDSVMEMSDKDEKLIGHLVFAAKKIAEKLNLSGYNLQFNVGKDGGQEIFHIHLHLMSKFA